MGVRTPDPPRLPKHVPAKNPPSFIFPNKDTPKTHPVSPPPIRIRQKPALFYTQIIAAGHLGAYAFAPLHGYMKNLASFGLKPSARLFGGVCFCVPTRVRAKSGGFYISAHVPAKNAPDFTVPNKDTPKSRPVLHPNRRRGSFQGRMQYSPTRIHAKFGGFHSSRTRTRPKPTRF